MKKEKIRFLAQGALIAALYAALGLEYPMTAYRDATQQNIDEMKYY